MFKFERFGGFSNKKNHIVQFKARDKTLSSSILGVPSPQPRLVSNYASTSSQRDLFQLPTPTPKKPSDTTTTKEQDKKSIHVDRAEPTPQPSSMSSKAAPAITKPIEKVAVAVVEKVQVEEEEEEEKEDDDGVFDFPDTLESKEIKLLVPVDKKSQKKHKTKKKTPPSLKSSSSSDTVTKKSTKATKKKTMTKVNNTTQHTRRPLPPAPAPVPLAAEDEENSIFDIFDFDFNPTVHIRHTPTTLPQRTLPPQPTLLPQPILFPQTTLLPHSTTNLQPTSYSNIPPPIYPYQNPMASIDSVLLHDPVTLQQVNDFLSTTPPPPPRQPPLQPLRQQQPLANISNTQPIEQPKKRKRNLVAHLKSASGETAPAAKAFDFLSDEEESLPQFNNETSDVVPFREFIQKERSMSPELSYNERMELELEAMMSSEFGSSSDKKEVKEQEEQQSRPRPRYQPQNKLNVKFTFERKK